MDIRLSDHFTYKKLLRFSLAPICSMIFTSLYSIVDGYFVSNYVGATAFASLNLVMPFLSLLCAVGFMFGAGGSALVAKQLGMREDEKANRYFSLIVYTTLVSGLALGAAGFVLSVPISRLMGATDAMLPFCVLYLRINMVGNAFFMLQQLFQTFFITAERPKLGFLITVAAGCNNMFLDWLLVGRLGYGLAGAAWATVLSQMVGGTIPLFLFARENGWVIRLGKTRFELQVIGKACWNGLGEFLSNISMSVVGLLYNLQLLRYAGENGVAAYGVIMYVSFVFSAVYIGYSSGVSPLISYNDGARNTDELKNLLRKSLRMLLIANLVMTAVAEFSALPLSRMFVGYDPALFELTARGMKLYSLSYLVMSFNFLGAALFTALNNGTVAAVLSTARTLVLQLVMIYLLPVLMETDGLWAAAPAVEGCALLLTVFFYLRNGKRYGYR